MQYVIGFILGAISFLVAIALCMVIDYIASKMADKKELGIIANEKRLNT